MNDFFDYGYLEFCSERLLRHPVEAGVLALALPVALEDAGADRILKSPGLIADISANFRLRIRCHGLADGQLPAGTTFLVLAVVGAVAAGQELVVQIDVHVCLRNPKQLFFLLV